MKKTIGSFLLLSFVILLALGSFTACGDVLSWIEVLYPEDVIYLSTDSAGMNRIEDNRVETLSIVYLQIVFSLKNDYDTNKTVDISVTIPDSLRKVKTLGSGSTTSVEMKSDGVAEDGNGGSIHKYSGSVNVPAGGSRVVQFYIAFKVENPENIDITEYASKITLECRADAETQLNLKGNIEKGEPMAAFHPITIAVTELPRLSPPNVQFLDEKLYWEADEYAKQYYYRIDDGELILLDQATSINTDAIQLSPGKHTIEISAEGDKVNYVSSPYWTAEITKLPAAAPRISVKDGVKLLTWRAIGDCTSYVLVDGNGRELKRVDDATELPLSELPLESAKTNIYVYPVLEGMVNCLITRSGQTPVEVTLLSKPTLSISAAGKLTWNAVAGAAHYDIYRNGVFFRRVTDTKCSLLGEGGEDYYGDTFYVIAGSTDANTVDSGASNTVTSRVN